jgi:hypothetical protein
VGYDGFGAQPQDCRNVGNGFGLSKPAKHLCLAGCQVMVFCYGWNERNYHGDCSCGRPDLASYHVGGLVCRPQPRPILRFRGGLPARLVPLITNLFQDGGRLRLLLTPNHQSDSAVLTIEQFCLGYHATARCKPLACRVFTLFKFLHTEATVLIGRRVTSPELVQNDGICN